jgi:DNA-binding transcriptional ArsR family regulator
MRNRQTKRIAVCPPKLAIKRRPLIGFDQANSVGRTFRVLADATRLRLLHALVRASEMCVGDLARAVEMKPQAVSNQLQRLLDRGILASRRKGNFIYYRIIDPCVVGLLDLGLCLTEDAGERES